MDVGGVWRQCGLEKAARHLELRATHLTPAVPLPSPIAAAALGSVVPPPQASLPSPLSPSLFYLCLSYATATPNYKLNLVVFKVSLPRLLPVLRLLSHSSVSYSHKNCALSTLNLHFLPHSVVIQCLNSLLPDLQATTIVFHHCQLSGNFLPKLSQIVDTGCKRRPISPANSQDSISSIRRVRWCFLGCSLGFSLGQFLIWLRRRELEVQEQEGFFHIGCRETNGGVQGPFSASPTAPTLCHELLCTSQFTLDARQCKPADLSAIVNYWLGMAGECGEEDDPDEEHLWPVAVESSLLLTGVAETSAAPLLAFLAAQYYRHPDFPRLFTGCHIQPKSVRFSAPVRIEPECDPYFSLARYDMRPGGRYLVRFNVTLTTASTDIKFPFHQDSLGAELLKMDGE